MSNVFFMNLAIHRFAEFFLRRTFLGATFSLILLAMSTMTASIEQSGIRNGIIVQLFEWSWNSVASECSNFIGPAGYDAVQVSPVVEHIQGPEWYTSYQSVSYQLDSKRGNRLQFAQMVSTCHAAGVKIIVDVVFNHMTPLDSGVGVAGSQFSHYDYPGIYQYQDFHHCGLAPGDDITNFTDRLEVQTCELVNLADLATETLRVRNRLALFANDLISLGVDGFRLDLAKNIAATDIADILSLLNKRVYITQEVAWGLDDDIKPSEYVGNGQVQDFRFTTALLNAFSTSNISSLHHLVNDDWVLSPHANIFVANHDTERMRTSLNVDSPGNTYINANIFSLAHSYGTPTILSSYSGFTTYAAGAPNGGVGTCLGNSGTNGWLCQHRWAPIAAMVQFRRVVGDAKLTNWNSTDSDRIAFERDSAGFVAINNADTVWLLTALTTLPSGRYCDVISGKHRSGRCSNSLITIRNGALSVKVPARNAVAIHIGERRALLQPK